MRREGRIASDFSNDKKQKVGTGLPGLKNAKFGPKQFQKGQILIYEQNQIS